MSVFANWHLICDIVSILLNFLNFFLQTGVKRCLSHLLLKLVIAREKEHFRLAC